MKQLRGTPPDDNVFENNSKSNSRIDDEGDDDVKVPVVLHSKPDKGKKGVAQHSEDDQDGKAAKKDRFKMKLEKLMLNNNLQTEDGLKHVYTVLISNPTLLISIDFPAYKDRVSKIESDSSDEEPPEKPSPTETKVERVVPVNAQSADEYADAADRDPEERINEESEESHRSGESTDRGRQLQEDKDRKQKLIKKFCCKSLFYLLNRDKTKKLTCSQIFCGNFLKARMHLLRFKISWDYLVKVEKQTAPRLFAVLVFQIVVYFSIGAILPFLASFLGQDECSSVSPYYVYGAYGWFFLTSTIIELAVLLILRQAMRIDGKSMLPFNRYLAAKWLQGQFSNFVYFMHFCYVAAALVCLKQKGVLESLAEGIARQAAHARGVGLQGEGEDPATAGTAGQEVMKIMSSILAIIATPILVISNVRRVYWIAKNFKKQPEIHKLLPNMQRNMQLAWLLNFQATAVALESTSLSDYIYENGGPIVAGKAKDLPQDYKYPVQKKVNKQILGDKMKYQDVPMLGIMTIQFFATFGEGTKSIEMVVSLVQIACTVLAILSAYIDLKFDANVKGVNIKQIQDKVKEREQEFEARKKEGKNDSKKKKKVKMEVSHTQEESRSESSSDSEEESSQDRSAAVMDDVVGELREMTKGENRSKSPEQDQMPLDHQKIEVQTGIQDKNPSIEPDKEGVTPNELKQMQDDDRDRSVNQDASS